MDSEFVRYRDFILTDVIVKMSEALDHPEEDIPPMLMLLGEDWADAISLVPYADNEGGLEFLASVGLKSIVERTNPVRACLIFPAWGRWSDPGEKIPASGVKHMKGSEELVVVQIADKEGFEEWEAPVKRHDDRPCELGTFEQRPVEGVFKEALKRAFE